MVITHFSRSPSTPPILFLTLNLILNYIQFFTACDWIFQSDDPVIPEGKFLDQNEQGSFWTTLESILISPNSWSYWTAQPQPNQYDFPSPFRQSSWPLRETDTDHVWNISFQSDLTDVKSGPLLIWKFSAMALWVVGDNDMFLSAMTMIWSWGFLFCISFGPHVARPDMRGMWDRRYRWDMQVRLELHRWDRRQFR